MPRLFPITAALLIAFALPSFAVEPGLPSVTSITAASLRAIGAKHPDPGLRNPDYLAGKFLGPRERAVLKDFPMDTLDLDYASALKRLSPQDLGSVTTMVIRTKHFDAALDRALRSGVRQVVILGAGLDSRGYRFHDRLRNVRFIEVDYGPTQEFKRQRVKEIVGQSSAEIRYVPMDFTKDDLLTQLRNGGYSENEQTLYLWEGVTMYLPEDAVRTTLRFIQEHSAPSSTVVFDYTLATDPRVNNPSTRFARLGEPWLFGFPGNSARDLLVQVGLVPLADESMGNLAKRYARPRNRASTLPALTEEQQSRHICIARVPSSRR
jgi:methyltransferase (TIGR00027 family)